MKSLLVFYQSADFIHVDQVGKTRDADSEDSYDGFLASFVPQDSKYCGPTADE